MSQGNWNNLFSTLCWSLWLRRNERVFENKVMSNEAVLLKSQNIIEVLNHSKEVFESSDAKWKSNS